MRAGLMRGALLRTGAVVALMLAGLWALGVENGGTETPEAALIRLWLG